MRARVTGRPPARGAQRLGQQVAVRGRELVAQRPDLLGGQCGGRVGVHERGLAHEQRVARAGGLDREPAHGHVGLVHGRALEGQGAHRDGHEAVPVHDGGHLDDGVLAQVVDEAAVGHVDVDLPARSGDQRVDDLRRVLARALLQLEVAARGQGLPGALELGEVLVADAHVLQGLQPVPLDLRVRAQEPGQVLRGVLAGLRRVVADAAEDLDAHAALELRVGGDALAQQRVQVAALVLPLEQPRLVVDAGGAVAGLLDRHAHELGQVVRGPVHAVAQPGDLELGRHHGQPPHVHGHRVGVVEQPRVGAQLAHVGGERLQHGEGAQRTEDAAHAGRVADGLAQPVPGGDLEVALRGGHAAHLDHVDHEVGAVEGRAAVGRRDDGRPPAELPVHLAGRRLGDRQPLGVDVVEHETRVHQLGEAQDVGDELPGEDDAPGADERDADHADDHPWARARCARMRSDFPENDQSD
nr:hypothetical protein GCM10025730_09250 [Promicromonospora thailandica]